MAKQSLASKSGNVPAVAEPVASNPGHDWLPDAFKPQEGAIAVSSPAGGRSPYVSFVSTKGPAFSRIASFIPTLEDGDPVMIYPEPRRPIALTPFRFFLLKAFQHWSVVDSKGNILRTTLDPVKGKKDRAFAEHIETVLLVVVPDGLECARCTFKTTKVNAAHRAIETLEQLGRAERGENGEPSAADWYAMSPEHKVTQAAPVDWSRFSCTVKLRAGTGQTSGFDYVAATSIPLPATSADWLAIGNFFKDENKRKQAEECEESYQRRITGIKSKVEG